jgi:hypothetical protein
MAREDHAHIQALQPLQGFNEGKHGPVALHPLVDSRHNVFPPCIGRQQDFSPPVVQDDSARAVAGDL